MTTNPVAAWTKLANTTTNPSTYKAQIDANSVVATRFVDQFAPFQSTVPNMTITVDPGHLYDGTTLTEAAQQISGTITAPSGSNKRIDRAVVDNITGVLSIITGTPTTGTPAAPAITAGKTPIAQIGTTAAPLLSTTTAITNSMIVDERDLSMLGKQISSQQTIASASTTDLGTKNSNNLSITGNVTITAFGSAATLANPVFQVTFTGTPLLTYNASSLKLPGSANIQAQAGDSAVLLYTGSGNWTCLEYQRGNGQTITPFGAEVSLASNTTTDLGAQISNQIAITGTTTITAFGSTALVSNPLYFLRFTGSLTLTNNASSLILPGGNNITTQNGDTAIALYFGSGNWKVLNYTPVSGKSVVASLNVLYNYISQCTLSRNVGTPNTKIDVAVGMAADSTNTVMITSAGYTVNFATNGAANTLDTGTFALNKWYHLFLIMKTDGTTAALGSLSATAPTLPSGYVYFRRIGSCASDGSVHFIPFLQIGGWFEWLSPTLDQNAVTINLTATLLTLNVPTGVKVIPNFTCFNTAQSARGVYFSSPDQNDDTPSTSAAPMYDMGINSSFSESQPGPLVWTDTSARIRARCHTAAMSTFNLTTRGWYDWRGMDG